MIFAEPMNHIPDGRGTQGSRQLQTQQVRTRLPVPPAKPLTVFQRVSSGSQRSAKQRYVLLYKTVETRMNSPLGGTLHDPTNST
jgi:hypothetical protein